MFTITCKDVLAAGSGVVLDLQELLSLKLLSNNELENCLVYLGKEKLQPKQAQVIWLSVRQVSNIFYSNFLNLFCFIIVKKQLNLQTILYLLF